MHHGPRERRRVHRAAGFTILELAMTSALLGVLTLLTFDALTRMSRPSNQGVAEQEAARIGGALLDRIMRELRYADADTIVVPADDPSTITFQEVLAYEGEVSTDGTVVRSRPITLRLRAVAGAAGSVVERFENPSLTGIDDDALIAICHKPDGPHKTIKVRVADLETHVRHGDTVGPCGSDAIPMAADAFDSATVLGGSVAPADKDAPALPGLHFAVRRAGRRTYVDVALTVVTRAGGESAERRLQTSVGLINRAPR